MLLLVPFQMLNNLFCFVFFNYTIFLYESDYRMTVGNKKKKKNVKENN